MTLNRLEGKRVAIARPPSVIDQHVGSHSLCLYVCWCMYGCGCFRDREGERERAGGEILPTSWACATSYKKTGNKE